jgi:hypothetical protein
VSVEATVKVVARFTLSVPPELPNLRAMVECAQDQRPYAGHLRMNQAAYDVVKAVSPPRQRWPWEPPSIADIAAVPIVVDDGVEDEVVEVGVLVMPGEEQ